MSKKLKCFTKKRDSYYYTPTINGKTKWIQLGKDKSTALLKYHQMVDGKHIGVTVDQLLEAYERSEEFSLKRLSQRSIDTYENGMRHVREAMGHLYAEELNAVTISRFIHEAPGASGNSWVSPLSMAYRHGILTGLVETTPFRKGDIQYAKTPVRVRVVNLEEILAVREYIGMEGRLFIDICLLTGLRISDILALTKDNVTDEGLRVEIQKKRRAHQVLLFKWTPELRALCESLPFDGISTSAMSKRFLRARLKAGVSDLNCHDIRRYVLQEAKRRGISAQEIAGHSNAKQTANYTLGVPESVAPLPKQGSTVEPSVESLAGRPALRLVQ